MTERAGSLSLGALAFDAYGTLFDVHSVVAACEAAFPSRGEALSRLWRATGLTAVFDELISVEAVRIYKPSPRVYALLPQRLGVPPGEIGFVSSNAFDITGAKAFGLRTCWVNRQDATPDGLGYPPTSKCVRWRNWPTASLRSGRRLRQPCPAAAPACR